jgi:hypothetical protein
VIDHITPFVASQRRGAAACAARTSRAERSADIVALGEHRRSRDAPTTLDGLPAAG